MMLTPLQKELLKTLVTEIRAEKLSESFRVSWAEGGAIAKGSFNPAIAENGFANFGTFSALVAAGMLIHEIRESNRSASRLSSQPQTFFTVREHFYALTKKGYDAVDTDFREEPSAAPLSSIAHSIPPELNLSMDRLRKLYPDPAKLGFLIMRFSPGSAFSKIAAAIKETAAKHGISVVRADDHQFHADLWGNVRTYLHGCSFGIAVYERIDQDEPNANVGLEVGYLLAMNKSVLLFKEQSVKTLQADLMGKLYKQFDEHNAAGTIPDQLLQWFRDNGVLM